MTYDYAEFRVRLDEEALSYERESHEGVEFAMVRHAPSGFYGVGMTDKGALFDLLASATTGYRLCEASPDKTPTWLAGLVERRSDWSPSPEEVALRERRDLLVRLAWAYGPYGQTLTEVQMAELMEAQAKLIEIHWLQLGWPRDDLDEWRAKEREAHP